MENTRIIPNLNPKDEGKASSGGKVDQVLIKMEVRNGKEEITGGDPENAQRFEGEVKYVAYFAQRLADALNMHSLELGVIEDREGQTAFHATAGGGWHGVVGSSRRSLKQVSEALSLQG